MTLSRLAFPILYLLRDFGNTFPVAEGRFAGSGNLNEYFTDMELSMLARIRKE